MKSTATKGTTMLRTIRRNRSRRDARIILNLTAVGVPGFIDIDNQRPGLVLLDTDELVTVAQALAR
jgi:tRNA A-37 threonylcarbamoyl transferase component Bud32